MDSANNLPCTLHIQTKSALSIPFINAVRANDVKTASTLYTTDNTLIHQRGKYNRTPLMMAAKKGLTEMVQFLMKKGALVNQTDNHDKTALMHAAENGQKDAVIALLTASDIAIHSARLDGKTAVSLAYENDCTEIVSILQSRGAVLMRSRFEEVGQLVSFHFQHLKLSDLTVQTAQQFVALQKRNTKKLKHSMP